MTNAKALQVVRQHFESLFPKTCASCSRQFATLRAGDWKPTEPIGSLALANCPCGSTLALTTEGMAHPQRLALLGWVKRETQQRGVSASELLERLRDDIRKQVLDGPQP